MMLGLMMLLFDYLGLDRLRCRSLGRGSRHGETRGQGENCCYCQGDDLFHGLNPYWVMEPFSMTSSYDWAQQTSVCSW